MSFIPFTACIFEGFTVNGEVWRQALEGRELEDEGGGREGGGGREREDLGGSLEYSIEMSLESPGWDVVCTIEVCAPPSVSHGRKGSLRRRVTVAAADRASF